MEVKTLLNQQIIINQLALALGEYSSLENLFETVYNHVDALLDVEVFIVSIFDKETELIHASYIVDEGKLVDVTSLPPKNLLHDHNAPQSRVIITGEPLLLTDFQDKSMDVAENISGVVYDELHQRESDTNTINSAILVPMKVEGETIGVMQFQSKLNNTYKNQDVDLLGGMANVLAASLKNYQLFEKIQHELTERKKAEESLTKYKQHLEEMVSERTSELRKTINLMAGREIRMAELKESIKRLRMQIESLGARPVADDPLKNPVFDSDEFV